MTKAVFEQDVLQYLSARQRQCPFMEQQDIVKFVFQAMLGVGHLLSDRSTVEGFLAREMDPLPADEAEPLYEMLSPQWCRLHLRSAKGRGILPSVIAGLMFSSDPLLRFTRQDVFAFCSGLASSGKKMITDPELLEKIRDENWLPSHSSVYREKVRPAYRVIPAEWIPCLEVIQKMAAVQAAAERPMVTIDGPCASGKTTLAKKLAEVFHAAVVHTDDYVIPHAQKTPERLGVPGGNCDSDRLAGEVAAPWKRGETVVIRKYDCRNDRMLPEEKLPDCRMLILEGSYCNLPEIRKYADLRVFADTPREIREGRLAQRESPQSLEMFRSRWIPLEDRYFEAYHLPDRECVVLKDPGSFSNEIKP